MNKKRFYKNIKGNSEVENSKLKKPASRKRWEIAHNSEEGYWKPYTTETLLKQSEKRYIKKARILLEEWSNFKEINKKTKILQVGCGPHDIINYLMTGEKYSIDPLGNFYRKKFNFNYNETNLIEAPGEKIPFPDKSFDIVILINVLDHTHLPEKALSEIKRVLKDDGIFHFEVYVYQKKFIQLAKAWGKLKQIFTREPFNIHHPYMFTRDDARFLITKDFKIFKEEIVRDIGLCENLNELEQNTKKSKSLTVKIPSIFGLYGIINYTAICKKK